MIQRCGSLSAAAEPAKSAFALERLSMYRAAPNIASRMNGIQIQPATGRFSVARRRRS